MIFDNVYEEYALLQAAELSRIVGHSAGYMAIALYQRMVTPSLAHRMNLTGSNHNGNLFESNLIKVVRGMQTESGY